MADVQILNTRTGARGKRMPRERAIAALAAMSDTEFAITDLVYADTGRFASFVIPEEA